MKRHIVFWQNIPSFHQSATIRALASKSKYEITLAYQDELSQVYQERGWLAPNFGQAKVVKPKNDDDISNLLFRAGDDAVHIFSGIRFPMVRKAFLAAKCTNKRIGLLSEAADWRGPKGFARLLLYRAELGQFRSKIDFILAMGQLGVSWYLRCGFPANKIHPFCYVVEKLNSEGFSSSKLNSSVRLIFVGQCIRRKGLDVLLSALTTHRNLDWHLDVVGDGPERDKLVRRSKENGLSDKVTFNGTLGNAVVRRMVAQSDCLILPSRWDGWGAVVNEALMMGVPVICSDACGAADLLGSPERGELFKVNSALDLERVLGRWICKGKKTKEATEYIKSWAKSIEGETVANYLLDVIEAAAGMKDKPAVPWRNEGQPCT